MASKKECPVCGKKIGILTQRFKIKDKKDKIVVCGGCMNKAGYHMNTSIFVLRKLTLDDLQKELSEKETNRVTLSEKQGKTSEMNAMNDKEDLLAKMLLAQRITLPFGRVNSIICGALEEVHSNEEILTLVVSGGGDGYLVLTNNRVFYREMRTAASMGSLLMGASTNNGFSITLDKISSVSVDGSSLSNKKININASGNNYEIEKVPGRNADLLVSKLRAEMGKPKVTSAQTVNVINQKSPVEQVKELKELLDMGIITQEEFDKKKNELLGL